MSDPAAIPIVPPKPPEPVMQSGGGGKEQEAAPVVQHEQRSTATHEVVVVAESANIETVGVAHNAVVVELPPDVKAIGAMPRPAPPAPVAPTLPAVALPISDQQVVVGSHSNLSGSLAWLAVWCQKKLKKAHLALRVIQGKVVREIE